MKKNIKRLIINSIVLFFVFSFVFSFTKVFADSGEGEESGETGPRLKTVVVAGIPYINEEYTAYPQYEDLGDIVPIPTYTWYYKDSLDNLTLIPGKTSKYYTISQQDLGKILVVKVNVTLEDIEFETFSGNIVIGNSDPSVDNALILENGVEGDDVLEGVYSYSDNIDRKSDYNESILKWYRSDDSFEEAIQIEGENTAFYTISPQDFGKTIYFEVTAKSSLTSNLGNTEVSLGVKIANSFPIIDNLTLEKDGDLVASTTLSISYDYSDTENYPEENSILEWYRDGILVEEENTGSENPLNYILSTEDIGKTITFKIIPRSSLGVYGEAKSIKVSIPDPSKVKPKSSGGGGVLPLPNPNIEKEPVIITYYNKNADGEMEVIVIDNDTKVNAPKETIDNVKQKGYFVSPLNGQIISCNELDTPIVYGSSGERVKLIQAFLNKEIGVNMPITGYFGAETKEVTQAFQSKYESEIMTPLGLYNGTGNFYSLSLNKVKSLVGCPH